jgi:NAD(P)-dependent dehydrogenase (short-subunit alcohol dehydrogenase family)
MSSKIKDKVIVITGASSGLGQVAARLLSAQGAYVVVLRNPQGFGLSSI